MKKQLHLVIHGKVQGVFFCASVKENADKLNLTGWVRNNSDGTLEAIFEGEEIKLQKILDFCKEEPGNSVVKKVEEEWLEFENKFEEFRII